MDSKTRSTLFLLFGAIAYLAAIVFFVLYLSRDRGDVVILFSLALLPFLVIFAAVWRYSFKAKLPGGIELDYYPVERIMKPPSIISEEVNGAKAENIMENEGTDFLNILDREGVFRGIFTKADAHKARMEKRIKNKVKDLMTEREKVIHALEQEDLRSIMEKIGQTKHSRLPVLDQNNRLMGVVDAVDINDLLSKLLK